MGVVAFDRGHQWKGFVCCESTFGLIVYLVCPFERSCFGVLNTNLAVVCVKNRDKVHVGVDIN